VVCESLGSLESREAGDPPHARLANVPVGREQFGDEAAIRAVHAGAFRRPEDPEATPPEAGLVDELRASEAWLPRLCLVATIDGHIVGHVVCTRAHVETEPVLALGPIGVDPSRQNQGVGQTLMKAVIAEPMRWASH
jgi:putative acetyltransferase